MLKHEFQPRAFGLAARGAGVSVGHNNRKGTAMKKLLTATGAFAFAALAFTSSSFAQHRSFITSDAGFYYTVDGGATIPMDGNVTRFGSFSSGQKVDYGVGAGFDLAGGYAFNKYFAVEIQTGWTWNPINSIEGALAVNDTSMSAVPFLANAVVELPIPRTIVVPYLGAGVGGAFTVFDTDGYTRAVPGGTVSLYDSSSDFVFAWQAFAGVRFQLNDKMTLGVGYRYLYTGASTFDYGSFFGGGPTLYLGLSSYQTHQASITFQMKF